MMVRPVISKSAALEISGIAQYLKDELASPGAASSFIQEFRHQAKLACSFPSSHALCPHPELAQREVIVRFAWAGMSQSIPSRMIA